MKDQTLLLHEAAPLIVGEEVVLSSAYKVTENQSKEIKACVPPNCTKTLTKYLNKIIK